MRFIRKFLITTIISLVFSFNVWAANSFIVRAIRIRGLGRLSRGTVLTYLPIRVGQRLDPTETSNILRALYNTGFFSNVQLGREGNTLIVTVVERPSIGLVTVTGNRSIKKKNLKKMLKQMGLQTGHMFDRSVVASVKQELLNQYYNLGHYNAQVDIITTPEARNRVGVHLKISEGSIAKIREIKIIGNHSYATGELLHQLVISTPKLWSFITKDDRYSKPKLDASLEKLKSFYMNRGYLRFRIDSTQVSLTPDKTGVYIVIRITEGPQYTYSGFSIRGRTIIPKSKLRQYIPIHKGDIFSRAQVEQATKTIGTAIGDKGYAFAKIDPIPTINDKNHTVYITFYVSPGHKVYVRRVTFKGNTITADYVLRTAVQQMEGSLINVSKIRSSIRELNLLGFFKDVTVKTTPVPGTTNQVDLDYSVKEKAAGTASVTFGYGTLGFDIGAGITQPNFMGTGRSVGVNINRSRFVTSASFNYFNPYFTTTGIGHGFSVYYTHTKPEALNLADYTFDTWGASSNYSIPLSLNDSVTFSYGYNNIRVRPGKTAPLEITTFIRRNGSHFNQILLATGWTHVGQDRAIFPTKGLDTDLSGQLSVPITSKTIRYYKLAASAAYYLPLNKAHSYVFYIDGGVGYGNGYGPQRGLPFFANYYAGGLSAGQVRGYQTNTLGPKASNGDSIGGNFLVYGSAAFIFPNHISQSLRTDLFVDAGNVYQTNSFLKRFIPPGLGSGPIRFSAGLGVEWRSPVGPISISLAAPLNKQKGDDTEPVQFTMGTSL